MDIGIIRGGRCENVAVFGDMQTAEDMLAAGVFGDADSVIEVPDGMGIGDRYEDGVWIKTPVPPDPIAGMAAEITDLQLALAEVYGIIAGGGQDG